MSLILIADDHGIVRIGATLLIREIIGKNTEIEESATFDDVLIKLTEKKFDLVLLDINLPGGNNLSMINAIRIRDSFIKILIFSSYEESIFALRYIQAGASGYLSKDSSEDQFKKALITVLEGNIYISSEIKDDKISNFLGKKSENTLESLSNREMEVANLLIQGYSISEIAQILNIRINTVSTYKSHIYTKLNVSNIVDLIERIKVLK